MTTALSAGQHAKILPYKQVLHTVFHFILFLAQFQTDHRVTKRRKEKKNYTVTQMNQQVLTVIQQTHSLTITNTCTLIGRAYEQTSDE